MNDVAALVMIVMGSQSDQQVVKDALDTLDRLGVPHEVHIASAHRTPERAARLAREAKDRGIKVIIAAAGAAAHLAGVIAAHTTLPVIGIPIVSPVYAGLDALLSMVQMPRGVPVATVSANGAQNAALLAAEILAISDPALATKLDAMRQEMAEQVDAADAKLRNERT
ncbi:MAG: 5-(carboxyamino)imidazole ribonucleotide mutase [Armatimonadota bacterium]